MIFLRPLVISKHSLEESNHYMLCMPTSNKNITTKFSAAFCLLELELDIHMEAQERFVGNAKKKSSRRKFRQILADVFFDDYWSHNSKSLITLYTFMLQIICVTKGRFWKFSVISRRTINTTESLRWSMKMSYIISFQTIVPEKMRQQKCHELQTSQKKKDSNKNQLIKQSFRVWKKEKKRYSSTFSNPLFVCSEVISVA